MVSSESQFTKYIIYNLLICNLAKRSPVFYSNKLKEMFVVSHQKNLLKFSISKSIAPRAQNETA